MRSCSEARTGTAEPSLPLSQFIRALSSQRPAPTRARRGVHWKRRRPRLPTFVEPMWNAFWSDRSDSRTVRLQNSITGQPLPVTVSFWPKCTGLGEAEIDGGAAGAAPASSATAKTGASTRVSCRKVAMRAFLPVDRPAVAKEPAARAAVGDAHGPHHARRSLLHRPAAGAAHVG